MTEELAVGDVLFRQRRLAPTERISRRYDLIIGGLSWESRGSVALARLDDPTTAVTLLKFGSRSSAIEQAKNHQLAAFEAILSLVIIKETAPSTFAPMLASERLAYDELLREPNFEQEDIALCDALGVVRHAVGFASGSHARGTTAMAIGSKPHALALGIAALANPTMEVVCRTPASYRSVNVAASGHVMLYEIEDRFDPTSYIAPS